ncbi:hypothetical protein [Natronorubrum tibetense]|uniref:Uncharacterized protein n=1 Tax=Natronorubrum tibetense GA33 TaxID=1114856 RepID=L9VED7_9EURY|nr:hypothetical protein [Natronorubrum tibetense]ELY35342.1 hypothetical protein C496_23448 [Natronorubrum tibetense GA33]
MEETTRQDLFHKSGYAFIATEANDQVEFPGMRYVSNSELSAAIGIVNPKSGAKMSPRVERLFAQLVKTLWNIGFFNGHLGTLEIFGVRNPFRTDSLSQRPNLLDRPLEIEIPAWVNVQSTIVQLRPTISPGLGDGLR